MWLNIMRVVMLAGLYGVYLCFRQEAVTPAEVLLLLVVTTIFVIMFLSSFIRRPLYQWFGWQQTDEHLWNQVDGRK